MSEDSRATAGAVGVGAAACAVCCAGPILAFVGGIGLAGIASTFLVGFIGIVVAATIIAVMLIRRRRRSTCSPPEQTISLDLPTRRPAETSDAR